MIAEGFLAQGARVYISARKAEQCQTAAQELGSDCIAMPADVSTVAGIRDLSNRLQAVEPAIDILINNAGATWGAEFPEFPESGWDKVFNLNVKAPSSALGRRTAIRLPKPLSII
jgi:NAD(P)-dependent dehydrogenase (short-subunit alcohol dehydrogenase family)